MAAPTGAHGIQHDEPAYRDVETREETAARVAGDDEAVGTGRGGSPDSSTRRGLNRALWKTIAIYAGIGFVVGAVLGLILSIAPGPVETGGVGEATGDMVGLGLAIALVVTLLASLFPLEREEVDRRR